MTPAEYREQYRERLSSVHRSYKGHTIVIPDDIERVTIHEPCPYCGTARGMCRHRIAA